MDTIRLEDGSRHVGPESRWPSLLAPEPGTSGSVAASAARRTEAR
ncbi:hypothetical protein [Plantactinospora alkalitolerans]|nr:hypothetical protein [Plantactinospora alkalitolerans]